MAFPSTPLTVLVEVAFGADLTEDPGTWSFTDVTDFIYTRDKIHITRGRPDESTTADPCSLTMTADNRDGRWSSRNPAGAWYGQIRKGIPVRVSAEGHVRFTGFISALPPRWDVSGEDRHAPIEAKGLLYRLAQGESPIRSPLRRAILGASPIVYWPLEDGAEATRGGSAVSGVGPLKSNGAVVFDGWTLPPGSAAAPDLSDSGRLVAPIASSTTTAYTIEFVANVALSVDDVPLAIRVSGGTAPYMWFLCQGSGFPAEFYVGTPGTGPFLMGLDFPTLTDADFDNQWHHYRATLEQVGSDVSVAIWLDGVAGATITTAMTLGRVTGVEVNSGILVGSTIEGSVGHVAIYDYEMTEDHSEAMLAHAGEEAHTRFLRLCAEEGIPATCDAGASQQMGPQTQKSLLELLRECEAADVAFLYDSLDFGLVFQSHTERENQPPALELDYEAAGHIAPPLEPTDDDVDAVNDVEVKRVDGSSARITQEDPAVELSIPNIGRRDTSVELNLYGDDQLLDGAGWRLHLGTWPGYRFPVLTLNLAAGPTLIDAFCTADLGFRTTIENPPEDIGPDDIDLIVEGYSETLNLFDWDVSPANCSLGGPWHVGVLAEDSMTMLTAKSTTNTSFRVASDPPFTQDTADLPVSLMVDGEEVSVTGVVEVAVSIANGTPVHGDNASLAPVNPSHVEGDLLLLFAAIRNSGTGTVDTPAGGWSSFVTHGNIEVFYLYATSDATPDPTVVFTGGVAGATTSAVVIRARGLQFNSDAVNDKGQLNGSAQDIAYPYYVVEGDVQVFNFSWKQDDYTSVAVGGGGMAEQLEASTTTGDDQSLYIARLSTTVDAFPIVTNSHTVTGGASAISRSVFFTLLRGVVDMTVTRSVNGVVTTHAQGATVEVAHPMNLAL